MATDGNAITTKPSGKKYAVKDPNAVLDFTFDWTDWLADLGDTYQTHDFIIEDPDGAGVPLVEGQSFYQDGKITVFLSGGTTGMTHKVTCRITTFGSGGTVRIDDRSLYVQIKER